MNKKEQRKIKGKNKEEIKKREKIMKKTKKKDEN